MEPQDSPSGFLAGLQWKWVIVGVIAGAAVMGIIVGVTARAFHSTFVSSLIGSIGFVVTGMIVGYKSPGVTIREAAVGGCILALLVMFSLLTIFGQDITLAQTVITAIFGFLLAFVGGWVGENLQEEKSDQTRGLQWRWVGVGVVVAFVLNAAGVFLLAPLFNYNLDLIFVTFLVSFVVAGYVVGYTSPGVTVKEAAMAGAATVIIDWLLVEFGMEMHVPMRELTIGLVAGFLMMMLGAWVGELLQASMKKAKA
jgi:hypothetical protein